jgi:tight adherence protein C
VSPTLSGAGLGACAGLGTLLVGARLRAIRRPSLAIRVLPYVRDVQRRGGRAPFGATVSSPLTAAWGIFAPALVAAAGAVECILGGAASVRRRLARAGLAKTVHDFRVEQVLWGVGGFAVVAAYCLLTSLSGRGDTVGSLLLCAAGFATGVMARDTYLSSQVTARERRVLAEFPVLAELLALAVAAGESPVRPSRSWARPGRARPRWSTW